MGATLEIQDANGATIPLDDTNPAAFGTVGSGSTSDPVELQVANTGDEDAFFVKVRAIEHPTAHAGDEEDTASATEFSTTENGDYDAKVDLGTIAAGASSTFWARWAVPADAPAGDVVWAIEAIGAET